MITEDKLLLLLEQNALHGFKVDFELNMNSFFLLSIATIDELIKFAKVNNINSIFYSYFYFDKESYLIDLEEAEYTVDESIYTLIKKEIVTHNKKIEKMDFTTPRCIAIFVLYQGKHIGIMNTNNWLEQEELLEADEQLDYFMGEYEYILEEKRKKEEEKLNCLKIEFEEYLLNDDEFLNCTNQRLRRHYMRTVFDKSDARKYKSIFMNPTRFGEVLLDNASFWVFIETVWKKYKSNKNSID